jgi:hypothetical protein
MQGDWEVKMDMTYDEFELAVLEKAQEKIPEMEFIIDFEIAKELRYYYDMEEFEEAVEALIDYNFELQETY